MIQYYGRSTQLTTQQIKDLERQLQLKKIECSISPINSNKGGYEYEIDIPLESLSSRKSDIEKILVQEGLKLIHS